MVMYAYKGIGPSGKTVTGVKDADSPKLVRALLRKDGVVVTSVELSKQGGAKPGVKAGSGLCREVDLGAIFRGGKNAMARHAQQMLLYARASTGICGLEQLPNVPSLLTSIIR